MFLCYLSAANVNLLSSDFIFSQYFEFAKKKTSLIAAIKKIVSTLKPVTSNLNIGLHWFRSEDASVAAISDVDEICLQRQGHWKSVSNKILYIQNSIGRRLSNITNNKFVSS